MRCDTYSGNQHAHRVYAEALGRSECRSANCKKELEAHEYTMLCQAAGSGMYGYGPEVQQCTARAGLRECVNLADDTAMQGRASEQVQRYYKLLYICKIPVSKSLNPPSLVATSHQIATKQTALCEINSHHLPAKQSGMGSEQMSGDSTAELLREAGIDVVI